MTMKTMIGNEEIVIIGFRIPFICAVFGFAVK